MGKFFYDLLKPVFITSEMIKSYYDHAVFTWTYKSYKSIITVDTDEILMTTQHRIFFERLNQEFDTLFYYTLKEGKNLNLLNITNIQSKYGISIDQTDYSINSIIQ